MATPSIERAHEARNIDPPQRPRGLRGIVEPQNYGRPLSYRPPAAGHRRVNNTLGVFLTSLGFAPRDAVTLAVRGRRSGEMRRIPILRTLYRGDAYLVSLAGESEWVRNVRAAEGLATIRRRTKRPVRLVEVPLIDRAEILYEYYVQGVRRSGAEAGEKQARYNFGLEPNPSLEDFRKIASRYPVFRITEEPA